MRGIRQDFVLSPITFNTCFDGIFKSALENETTDTTICDTVIDIVEYADDMVILI